MAMDHTFQTPEDKLLEIIENPALAEQQARRAQTARLLSVRQWLPWLMQVLRGASGISLGAVSGIIGAMVLVCVVAGAAHIMSMRAEFATRILQLQEAPVTMARPTEDWQLRIFDLPASLRAARQRNIFTFFSPEPQDTTPPLDRPVTGESLAADMAKIIEKLALVGILWSDTNPQAMIEDIEQNKTMLLNAGDRVRMFLIKAVRPDSVLLEHNGVEWILR